MNVPGIAGMAMAADILYRNYDEDVRKLYDCKALFVSGVERMEGTLAPVACLQKDAEECPRYASCVTLPLWQELDQLVHDFLYRKKLSELVHKA